MLSNRTGPKDWSPRKKWKSVVLYNLGDENPLDYGGYLIRRFTSPTYSGYDGIYWDEPEDDRYTVYTFGIEEDVMEDLGWIDDENWEAIADHVGITKEDIEKESHSKDIRDRANVYLDVGRYYGFDNLDSYPDVYERPDMEEFLKNIGFES